MVHASLPRFVKMALACVHREHPSHVSLLVRSDADLRPPRELTPCFYGCYDWHSAVHGHWLLARVGRLHPETFGADARTVLRRSITEANVDAEVRQLRERPGFERPYGLAWLLQLHAELLAWPEERAAGQLLAPLVAVAREHLLGWLPKLHRPVRSGVHSQTAFALGLVLDWARDTGDDEANELACTRARELYGADRDYAVHLEPSGEDFLSPSLAAADLMRRVLPGAELSAWLDATLPPTLPLVPERVSDPSDGRLAHLDGLNLSRAWMLDGIASALEREDPRRADYRALRDAHQAHALSSIDGADYMGSHWLGTFAGYLLTRRGVSTPLV